MNHVLKGWMTLLLLMSATVHAAVPVPRIEQAVCTRSAVLLACSDALGNGYSVAAAGKTMYLRGYEVIGKRSWAQTNSRYGQLVFLPGWHPTGRRGWVTPGAWAGRPSIRCPVLMARAARSPAT